MTEPREILDPNNFPIEEVDKNEPRNRRLARGYADMVRPLASRVAKLERNKCIRIAKTLSISLVSALRAVMENDHGYKLVMRSQPGETYFWRGEQIGGTLADMEKRRQRNLTPPAESQQ